MSIVSVEFTETKLMQISQFNLKQLYAWIRLRCRPYNSPMQKAMETARELKIALGLYSKGKKYDHVQANMLGIIAKIEKWVRLEFNRTQKKHLLRTRPGLVGNKAELKRQLRAEWEAYCKVMAY